MSAIASPRGFQPTYHPTGLDRAKRYTIASGYATAIFKNEPVSLNTNGTVTSAAGGGDVIGVLMGVQYQDATGRPQYYPNWAGGATSTSDIIAWVADDPTDIFEVQADGPIPQTAIGDQANMTNPTTGNVATGKSTCTLGSALVGAGAQGQFRIVGFAQYLDNAPGDAFTIVQVQIAKHPYVSSKVAI